MNVNIEEFKIVSSKRMQGVTLFKNISFGERLKCVSPGSGEKLDTKKSYCKSLLDMLMPISIECRVYNPKFHDDCYYGQGIKVKSILKKERQYYLLDLKSDLWTGLDNYWAGNDWHSTVPRYHAQGDAYFICDPYFVDWSLFFTMFPARGALRNVKNDLWSLSGYKNIISLCNDKNYIAIEFFSGTLHASEDFLNDLAILMVAYNNYYDLTVEDVSEYIFSDKDYIKNTVLKKFSKIRWKR